MTHAFGPIGLSFHTIRRWPKFRELSAFLKGKSSKFPGEKKKAVWVMDLLCNAYSTASDEEESDNGNRRQPESELPRPKRVRMETFVHKPRTMSVYRHSPSPSLPPEAPLPGRYISKRERAASTSGTTVHNPNSTSMPVPSPGSFLSFFFIFLSRSYY